MTNDECEKRRTRWLLRFGFDTRTLHFALPTVLGDGDQEIGGGEDLEVAVDFGVEPGAVDDGVGGGFPRHFLDGEGISQP